MMTYTSLKNNYLYVSIITVESEFNQVFILPDGNYTDDLLLYTLNRMFHDQKNTPFVLMEWKKDPYGSNKCVCMINEEEENVYFAQKIKSVEMNSEIGINGEIDMTQEYFTKLQYLLGFTKKKYIGKLGNNSFVKDLLSTKVEYLKELVGLERRNNKWTLQFKDKDRQDCERLILTIPMEQCQKITNSLNLNLNFEASMEPNLTAMIAFNKPLKIPFAGIKFQKNPILGWAGNESSKLRIGNNKNLELWTLQSSLDFAKKYCHIYRDKKEEVLELMIQEFLNLFEIKNVEISHKDIHGWLYAFKIKNFFNKFYWNKDINLGICGDWMCGPKVEDAWSSATLLANQINNS